MTSWAPSVNSPGARARRFPGRQHAVRRRSVHLDQRPRPLPGRRLRPDHTDAHPEVLRAERERHGLRHRRHRDHPLRRRPVHLGEQHPAVRGAWHHARHRARSTVSLRCSPTAASARWSCRPTAPRSRSAATSPASNGTSDPGYRPRARRRRDRREPADAGQQPDPQRRRQRRHHEPGRQPRRASASTAPGTPTRRRTGNLEGAFKSDWNGNLVWMQDCHGDTYSVFPSNGAVYVAGHSHYCGNLGGYPQTTPTWTFQRVQAFSDTVLEPSPRTRTATSTTRAARTPRC